MKRGSGRSVLKLRRGLAVERYKKGEVSLGRASELAGVPLGQMINILVDFGVEANLAIEDYRAGLENLRKIW